MSNKDKMNIVIFLTLGAIFIVQGITGKMPTLTTIGACLAVLFPAYYLLKNRDEEPEEEEDEEELSKVELEELEEGLSRLQEWAYKELEERPVIYDYKYLHKVFETNEEYRDFLGWVRENRRALEY